MLLSEAKEKIRPLIGKRLADVLSPADLEGIIVNKGKTGQLLEIVLGMQNSPNPLDFDDGELKTNKCNKSGHPMETMFITQIMSIIDELIQYRDFYETHIYNKIRNLLYVPICKEGTPDNWVFLPYTHVQLESPRFQQIKCQLEKDYYSICKQINEHVQSGRGLHTSSGIFIQIRTKDSKPYRPIFSRVYNEYVSNKNFAFYFKKEFMLNIQRYKEV